MLLHCPHRWVEVAIAVGVLAFAPGALASENDGRELVTDATLPPSASDNVDPTAADAGDAETGSEAAETKKEEGKAEAKEEAKAEAAAKAEKNFSGANFGVAITLTADTGSHDRVDSATITGTPPVVRVTDDNNAIARVMLETHYFFLPRFNLFGFPELGHGQWGHGPFVGIQPGSDDIIDSVAMGWMIGIRRSVVAGASPSSDSFNLGLGIVVDPNTQILGDGFKEGRPPPAGETEVRYKDTNQTGILIVFSYAFSGGIVTGD